MRRHRLLSLALTVALVATPTLAPSLAWANEGKKEKKEAVTYFALAPINAVVLRRDGRRGVMTVETGLEIKDAKLMERAQASTPRLRAAFAQTLMVYAAGLRGGSPPDIDHISRELQKAADQVLGKPGSKVMLTSAMIN
ncbi:MULTISPECIES: hypothetical protein [unclassified Caulobacter]|uniref:hypothetical protein n=1 Tax=unclassified Caulobacter TaxID=2648921 RepID=UPI000783A44C|nr:MULTISPECIES: hypothetical protein [unclassified Caulobacter]AZS22961.1 hypothetical protein CSW63_21400 [Caulobacter sp. FWC26]